MKKTALKIVFPFVLIVMVLIFNACNTKESNTKDVNEPSESLGTKLFSLLSPSQTGIDFVNTLTETDSFNIFVFEYIYNGGGVAVADINNDSLPDILFTGNQSSCRLFLNEGKMKFKDITKDAGLITEGWCTGVTSADVNSDGFMDFYVCRSNIVSSPELRSNLLFINNGNLTFTESSKSYGLDNKGYSTQSVFFDYDRDSDLDLFLLNHPVKNEEVINNKFARNSRYDVHMSDHLYRNNGDGTFTNVTAAAGVASYAFSLSVSITDFNNDDWPDIYVCNDYLMPDFLYINNRNGTFTDRLYSYMRHTSHFSMGSDIGDINNDGLADLVQLDMLPEDNHRQKIMGGPENYDKYMLKIQNGYGHQLMKNVLQLNNGNGTFSEIGELAGISKTDWSWAPLMADFDNDGYTDIYITNGYVRDVTNMDFVMYRHTELREKHGPYNAGLEMLNTAPSVKTRDYMYKNNGDLTFTNMSAQWGLDHHTFSNGAVYSDLDRDGDLDLVVSNINDSAFVYMNNRNLLPSNNYLTVKLEGEGKNRNGIGAKVTVIDSTAVHTKENYFTRGYLSAVDNPLHFGLGKSNSVKNISVVWPDGKKQQMKDVKANTVVTFKQSEARDKNDKTVGSGDPVFSECAAQCKISFTHSENDFIDFKNEPLLPHKFSQNGPGIAVADVNGDGSDDFYVGGAAGQSGKLFIQKPGGTFESKFIRAFDSDKQHEDMGCLFFDADNDRDADLVVTSGGSEIYNLSTYYQSRLYLNDGAGNFTRNQNALPQMGISSSCITAADYDADGDLDLFIGGRLVPGNYPLPAKSFLLQNNGGKFTDVTSSMAPDLEYSGLVCTALWTDFNNDGKQDLVVAGEWMPLSFFENNGSRFVNVTGNAGLTQSAGWWNSIAPADFDRDGDMDYVVGNFGLNNKIKTSPSKPACVYAGDFDKNGSMDAVICYYHIDGISYPIYMRDDLTDQIRPLKKKLIRYSDYADKTMEQLFTADEMKDSKIFYCHTFSTAWLRNEGSGKFSLIPLPIEAQISPTFGILADDFDKDGNTDILLTGNSYATEPELERHDAGNGLLLKGNGKGNFVPVKWSKSGFFTPHDSKAMAKATLHNGGELVLVSNNNSSIQAFQRNKKYLQSKTVVPGPLELKAQVTNKDKSSYSIEIPYGSGYLSQSTRTLRFDDDVLSVNFIDSKGNSRIVDLDK